MFFDVFWTTKTWDLTKNWDLTKKNWDLTRDLAKKNWDLTKKNSEFIKKCLVIQMAFRSRDSDDPFKGARQTIGKLVNISI